MWNRLTWILEIADEPARDHRGWLVIAVIVLLLILRHAIIAVLSHSERRR